MVEPVPLGEGTRELVLRDGAALDQHLLGRLARIARRLDGPFGLRVVHEPELYEDV